MKKIIILIFFIIYAQEALCNQKSEANPAARDPLIKREILFGNPDKIAPRLSGDGKYISFLAPYDGVLNIWVAPSDDLSKAKVITHEKRIGIQPNYFWAKNNSHIIYSRDNEGDENWHLYSVNIETGAQKDLTPISGVKAIVLKISERCPADALVLINERNPKYHDIYKIDIESGERTMVYENIAGMAGFVADEDFNIKFAYRLLESGEGELYLIENDLRPELKLFQKISAEDMLTTKALHVTADGKYLYMIDSTNSQTSALVEVDLATHQTDHVYSNPRADVSDIFVHPVTKKVDALASTYFVREWKVLDEKLVPDINILLKTERGDLKIVSRSDNDSKWIAAYLLDDGPVKYYLFDRDSHKSKFLFVSTSSQVGLPFSKMHHLLIKARDGMELVSYLTLPKWLDNSAGKPPHPLPMVLYVHGGPNDRENWWYNSVHQWLANRGYAVLSVNYRGSTGFGKKYINAGAGEIGMAMQDDLDDAVAYAVQNGIAIKDKVAIMGVNFGGYAALTGMARNPDVYAAGIDLLGGSNLQTLIESVPQCMETQRAHMIKAAGGSPYTHEGQELLKERSPLTHAANIKNPLMIVQGVKMAKREESDQIVKVLGDAKVPVVYLLYPDEGSSLVRPENKLSFYALAEVFLSNVLGGDAMPHENKFPSSSVQIKVGNDIALSKKVEK